MWTTSNFKLTRNRQKVKIWSEFSCSATNWAQGGNIWLKAKQGKTRSWPQYCDVHVAPAKVCRNADTSRKGQFNRNCRADFERVFSAAQLAFSNVFKTQNLPVVKYWKVLCKKVFRLIVFIWYCVILYYIVFIWYCAIGCFYQTFTHRSQTDQIKWVSPILLFKKLSHFK